MTFRLRPLPLLISALFANPALAGAPVPAALPPNTLPQSGQVVAGQASLSTSGARLDITQTTPRAIIDWQSFNIGSAAQVNFAQPNSTAVALNRVLAGDASQIHGQLSANGQVFLVNPSGVIFASGSRVDVGGLVASTLNIANDDFMAGRLRFERNGATGGIRNQGNLSAADGGYIALLAPEIINEGVVSARLGSVAFAAGERATLSVGADGRLSVALDPATVNTLIENRHLVQADGGTVLMSAQAAGTLLSAVVANPGAIEARTLENRAGRILLLADMQQGEVRLSGSIDASAPTTPSPLAGEGRGEGVAANGGFVETSAAHVKIADSARVTTLVDNGQNGTWLIDPVDYTIAASGGDISGATLTTNLAGGNITIQSTNGGAGTAGDVNVNDVVAWSANTLTLNAQNNININASLNGSGTAKLALEYGQGAVAAGNLSDYIVHAAVNLPAGPNFSTKLGSDGVVTNYTVITSLGVAGDATTTTLQGMKNNLTGKYVLGSDIDASATSGWNAGAGFQPIGDNSGGWGTHWFGGTFAGLGHAISNLTINRPASDWQGLFGVIDGGTVRDLGIVGGSIVGTAFVGGLAGDTNTMHGASSISNCYNTASVRGTSAPGMISGVGGLVGGNGGTILNSFSTGQVDGFDGVGGLVGTNWGTVSNSYSTGVVNGTGVYWFIGGLVGYNNGGTVNNSYYDIDNVTINGAHHVTSGGLYHSQYQDWLNNGRSSLSIASYLSQDGQGYYTLGSPQNLKDMLPFVETVAYKFRLTSDLDLTALPGWHIPSFSAQEFSGGGHTLSNLSVAQSFSGNVGFIGTLVSGSTITNLGLVAVSVAGSSNVGSMVGTNGGTINNSFSTGSVSGTDYVGGLVGTNSGAVSDSYSTATVNGSSSYVGGLIGNNNGTIADSYATGSVTGAASWIGGLVGGSSTASIGTTNSYWNTQTTGQAASAEGTPLTTAGMKQLASFSGWDISASGGSNAVWRIYEGQTAPLLRSFLTPSTVTANAASKTYDGLAYSGGNGITCSTGSCAAAGYLGAAAYSGTSQGAINANTYVITPSGLYSNQQGYDISYASGTLTVDPRTITVTASDQTRAYGSANPTTGSTAVTTGTLAGSDALGNATITAAGSATATANAGTTHTITPSVQTFSTGSAANYTISYVGGTLTITLAPLTATANAASKTYDGNAYSGGNGVAYSGFLNGETSAVLGGTLAYGGTSQGAVNAGSYTIAPSGLTSGNYTISYANGTLTIDTAPIVLTALGVGADNKSKTYGSPDPALTYTVSSGTLANGDSFSGSLTRDAGENTGNYTIRQGSLTVGANYSITFNNGTLTITPAPLTVTSNAASKTYDGNAYSGGNGVAYSGFVNGETSTVLGGTLAYGGNSQGAVNAGSYAIAPSGLMSGNYTLTFNNGTLTIDPAIIALGVGADNKSKTYGSADPELTWHITSGGLQGGDSFSGSLARDSGENAGSYAIRQGTLSAGGNYAVSFANGVLTIGKAPLTVTANTASKTYDGLAYSGGNGVSYSGFVNSETSAVLGGALAYGGTSQGAVNAGGYAITPNGLSAGNYSISFINGILSIATPSNGVTGGDIAHTLTERPISAPPSAALALMAAASPAAVNAVMSAIPGLMKMRADFIRLPGE